MSAAHQDRYLGGLTAGLLGGGGILAATGAGADAMPLLLPDAFGRVRAACSTEAILRVRGALRVQLWHSWRNCQRTRCK